MKNILKSIRVRHKVLVVMTIKMNNLLRADFPVTDSSGEAGLLSSVLLVLPAELDSFVTSGIFCLPVFLILILFLV